MEQVTWCGHLPVMRGGVATFTLQATQPFSITLQADPKHSTGAEPSGSTSTMRAPVSAHAVVWQEVMLKQ